jgi:DNA-binding CsgD family transcriptional regulator
MLTPHAYEVAEVIGGVVRSIRRLQACVLQPRPSATSGKSWDTRDLGHYLVGLRRPHQHTYPLDMQLAWPLTGRSQEMRLIETAISDKETSGMVISGPAGVGKSRLAREALDAAASRGCDVRWAVGTSSGQGVPLGAMASWAGLTGSDSLQFACNVIESLMAASPAGTVIVGVDDAHLLDDLSTFVLHQIVQRGAAKVVLTIRDDEPIPDRVQELWKVGQFARLYLEPLSPDSTTSLLSATLSGSLDPPTSGRLWQLTRGNVLYLRHIVEQEVADGQLEKRYGSWHWTGDPLISHDLIELIECRIGALPPAVSTVIDALAVGEPIELAALARITDPEAVEEAENRGLIRLDYLDDGIEVRVAHPLYGEVRRKRAARSRLRRLRGLVAGELAAADHHDDVRVVVRRAALSLDSDLEPDAELFTRAAQGAIWLADLSLANKLASAAARAGAGPQAQFTRAHALSWLGRGQEAEDALMGVPIAQLSDDDRARLIYLRASNMLWALADPARARTIIEDGSSRVAAEDARNCIDAVRAVYWFAVDQPDAATAASQNLVLDELPAIVGVETAWALATIRADAGQTADAEAMAEAGYSAAIRCAEAPHMRFNVADAHIGALLLAGRVDDALEVAAEIRQQAADLPGTAQMLGAAIGGRAALGAGSLGNACSLLDQATASLSAAGYSIGWGHRYRVPLATALAMLGLSDQATTVLATNDARRRPFRSLDGETSVARAWISASQGLVSEAIKDVRSAAERAAEAGRFATEVICLQTAMQFGDRSCGPRLRDLQLLVEGPRVGLATRFAVALNDSDAAELAVVSEDLEKIGDRVAALDVAAQAAVAYRRAGMRGSALRLSARAEALAAQCGGADTPASRQALQPLPLTDREREIVALLGRGLSNRDISERLVLSVRTVEGHILKAMRKTGTASRDELAAVLPHTGLRQRR